MAITFVKRNLIPTAIKGRVSTEPTITITANGQFQFNKLAKEKLTEKVVIALESEKDLVWLFRRDSKLGAKADDVACYEIKVTKGGSAFFGAAALLRGDGDNNPFKTHVYDFKASGNQTFKPEWDEKNGAFKFVLKAGSLTPHPVVERKKKAPTSVRAEAGSTNALAAGAGEGEIELEIETA